MKRRSKKLIGILSALTMLISIMPMNTFAKENGPETTNTYIESSSVQDDSMQGDSKDKGIQDDLEKSLCPGGELKCGYDTEDEKHKHSEECYCKGGEDISKTDEQSSDTEASEINAAEDETIEAAERISLAASGLEKNTQRYEVSTAEELDNVAAAVNAAAEGPYLISINADFSYTGSVAFSKNETTIIGNGHTITFNGTSDSIGFSTYNGATLNLGNADDPQNTLYLKANRKDDGLSVNDAPGFLYIYSNSVINMYSGVTIDGCVTNNYFGGGAFVCQGVFHMYGGTIRNCGVSGGSLCFGGGVAVMYGSQFIMEDGARIEDCFTTTSFSWADIYNEVSYANYYLASGGGGVYVSEGASFVMNGGSITGCKNESAYGMGGGVMVSAPFSKGIWGEIDSALIINGGNIDNNTAAYCGGGICITGGSPPIYAIAAENHTAIPNPNTAQVTVGNAVISENRSNAAGTYGGGGVCIFNITRETNINNCNILNNTASGCGGGINICFNSSYNAPVNIIGSKIDSNNALQGGGIALWNAYSPVTVKDSDITGNVTTSGEGGGIYYNLRSELTLAGKVVVQDNTYENSPNNLYFHGTPKTVNIEELSAGSAIGIIDKAYLSDESMSDYLTNGYDANNKDVIPSVHFTSDHEGYYADYSENKDDTRTASYSGDGAEVRLVKKPTVTLMPDDGVIADGKNVTEYIPGTTVSLPSGADITKDGYVFGGWYDNKEFAGEPVYSIPQNAAGDLIYYAKWKKADVDTDVKPGPDNGDNGNTDIKPGPDNGDNGNTDIKPGPDNSGNGNTDIKPAGSDNADKIKVNGTPETGDDSGLVLWISLLLLAISGVIIIIYRKKASL